MAAGADSPKAWVAADRVGRQNPLDRRPPDRLTEKFGSSCVDLARAHRLTGKLEHARHRLQYGRTPPWRALRPRGGNQGLVAREPVQYSELAKVSVMLCKGGSKC